MIPPIFKYSLINGRINEKLFLKKYKIWYNE